MISTDRNILKEESAVQARMLEYGELFDELHIIVFSRVEDGLPIYKRIGEKVHVYTTGSTNRLKYIMDTEHLGETIVREIRPKGEVSIVTQDPFETGFTGWLIAKKCNIPLNLQIHTDFLSPHFDASWLNKIRIKMARFLLPKADSIRVVSKRIETSLTPFELNCKPQVLPIWVDIQKIEDTCPLFYLKQKYPQFTEVILMVCRLEKEKNVSLAIEALKYIKKRHRQVGLIIVGDGKLKAQLEQEAYDHGVHDAVIFEGWKENAVPYYKTADIYLSTSSYEGFGLSLVEAAASGCPIVSTDVGLVGGVLSKDTSVLVCELSAHSIAEKIMVLLDDKAKRDALAEHAKEEIRKIKIKKATFLKNIKKSIV